MISPRLGLRSAHRQHHFGTWRYQAYKIVVPFGTDCQEIAATTAASPPHQHLRESGDDAEVRARILEAAFAAFMKNGYSGTSMLEIASRARVSKRELYSLVGNKQEMLMTCIGARARRLQAPSAWPIPHDRKMLAEMLAAFGAHLIREISDPTVIAVFRLAIAEAVHAPDVARTLDSIGREASRSALRQIMQQAQASGLLDGSAAKLAEEFNGLLWGTLMVSLLLGVAMRPDSREIDVRARESAAAFLRLHPPPS